MAQILIVSVSDFRLLGSGKSHFLKMLSYLISDKEVAGKPALEYFIEDDKITDPKVLADIRAAESVSTDVILFDIASRAAPVVPLH